MTAANSTSLERNNAAIVPDVTPPAYAGGSDIFVEEEESPFAVEDEPIAESSVAPDIDLGFVDSMPVRLPPIPSEDLEHVENEWLDNAYEAKLERSGEELIPIPGASKLAASLFGTSVSAGSNANGSAAPPAIDISAYSAPVFEEDPTAQITKLSANPTKEELFLYAQSHPLTRRAMRIFKAKIVDVKPRTS